MYQYSDNQYHIQYDRGYRCNLCRTAGRSNSSMGSQYDHDKRDTDIKRDLQLQYTAYGRLRGSQCNRNNNSYTG